MKTFRIRPIEDKDIPNLKHLQPEGWGDILFYFRFYVKESFCYPALLEHDNQIAGIANGLFIGRTGWLAHIIVAKEHYRKGFGYALTEHVINYIEGGCSCQELKEGILARGLHRDKTGMGIA